MELLSPTKINQDKAKETESARKRTVALADEESRLVSAVNLAKGKTATILAEMDATMAEYRLEMTAERLKLSGEVNRLEERRIDLLKPIDELKLEADEILRIANARASELDNRAKEIEANHEKNVELADRLVDRGDLLTSQENALESREEKIVASEKTLKDSANILADKWVEYHEAVNGQNVREQSLATKEAQVVQVTEANAIRKAEQDTRDHVLYEKKRGIIDGYAALQEAIREHREKGVKIL